jgi:phosphoenolpyruvate phosphomutase
MQSQAGDPSRKRPSSLCGVERCGQTSQADLLKSRVAVRDQNHDGLPAAVADRAALKGQTASGLSISRSPGRRDANEASRTCVVERLADSTELPLLVDGDSGRGNIDNARLPARKLLRRDVGGVAFAEWMEFDVYPRK